MIQILSRSTLQRLSMLRVPNKEPPNGFRRATWFCSFSTLAVAMARSSWRKFHRNESGFFATFSNMLVKSAWLSNFLILEFHGKKLSVQVLCICEGQKARGSAF
jgi:hypothetical protein